MNWQDFTTVIAVATASIFVAQKVYRSITARAGGGCSRCCGGPSDADLGIQRTQIIPIDDLTKHTGQSAK